MEFTTEKEQFVDAITEAQDNIERIENKIDLILKNLNIKYEDDEDIEDDETIVEDDY